MALLDRDEFIAAGSIRKEKVVRFVIRTEKRRAINDQGDPLFLPRMTKLMPVRWEEKHKLQKHLYESVTEYVRLGYNQAMRQNRQYLGFLMILMQRLVTSSTQAIASAMERRLEALQVDQPHGHRRGTAREPTSRNRTARSSWTNCWRSGWPDLKTRRKKSGCCSIWPAAARPRGRTHEPRRCSTSCTRTSGRRTTRS